MKKNLLVSLAAAVVVICVAQVASAQKAFEGSVEWKVVSAQMHDQEQHDMTMNIKGDKVEIDMDAGVQGIINMYVDRPNKKMTMVFPARKMGMVQSLPDDAAVAAASEKLKDVDLKATGQKSTINGRNAELYILTTSKETVNMWMSKDFTPEFVQGLRAAMSHNTRGSQAQKQVFRDLAEKGYFPVKIESNDGGKMELVNVVAKSLPDSKFAVPTDVMIMPMGGPGGHPGMQGGMPHGGMPQGGMPHGGMPQGGEGH